MSRLTSLSGGFYFAHNLEEMEGVGPDFSVFFDYGGSNLLGPVDDSAP
jgi:hypothetical protein